jgi:hypothetical protein
VSFNAKATQVHRSFVGKKPRAIGWLVARRPYEVLCIK